jgi:hypothetical protein
MQTVVESPARKLRRELGLPETRRTCNGDWMPFHMGDHVCERGGRHTGRVERIDNSAWVSIVWDNGWRSCFPLQSLIKVTQ